MVRIARSALLCGFVLLSACSSGADFALPSPGTFQLGKTMPADVIAKLGEPTQRSTTTTALAETTLVADLTVFTAVPASGTYERLSYFNGDRLAVNGDGVWAELTRHGLLRTRVFTSTFYDGKLVEYVGASSFEADRTDFDASKISSLARGKTTGDEVLQMFGKPNGGAIYPTIARRDGEALFYFDEENNVDSGRHIKLLQIFVDTSGLVQDYRSVETTLPNNYAPSTSSSVPIMVPSGKR